MLRAIYVSGGSLENEIVSDYRKMVKFSLSESRFSNNSIRISLFNACSIGASVKRSEINNFILDHQIDVFFIVETWLKKVLAMKQRQLTSILQGMPRDRFLRQTEVVVLLSLPRPTYCITLLLNPHSVLNIILLNCFKQHYR